MNRPQRCEHGMLAGICVVETCPHYERAKRYQSVGRPHDHRVAGVRTLKCRRCGRRNPVPPGKTHATCDCSSKVWGIGRV